MTTSRLVFDPFSREFFDNPYEIYRRMRDEEPVYYDEERDFYALTRHEDVAAAFKNFETFSSAYGLDLAMVKSGGPPPDIKLLQLMDPPQHRHMRSVLNKMFTPRAVQAQESMITATIDKYLDAIDGDEFDAVQQLTAPFPVEVITAMLGVPDEYVQQVRLWVDATLHREPGQIEMGAAGLQAVVEQMAFYHSLIQEHRDQPRDDLFNMLIEAEIERDDGGKSHLSDIEIAGFATQLGGAGAETVTKLLGNAVYLFARNPDQWQKLLDDRSKIPAAVEELLRFEPPAQYDVRCSIREITVRGVTIPPRKPVFLLIGSANRDPRAWTDVDTFDIDRNRTEAQNLGLGYGIHSCLGAALARMESAMALEKLLDFMPRYEVDWDGCRRVHMQNVIGWSNVPVRIIREPTA